jgi:DNA mismatch endonuclease (patch repair protein)
MDRLTPAERSENMRRIRSRDTNPELAVRSLVHRLGFRFRLHRPDLPGKPDLVFPSMRKVIFVHGCFWHQHKHCIDGRVPRSRSEYWEPKLTRNVERDRAARTALRRAGWRSLTIWECEAVESQGLRDRIVNFLSE